jgi:hypothetical protein
LATVLRLLAGRLKEREILSEWPDLETEIFVNACASPRRR